MYLISPAQLFCSITGSRLSFTAKNEDGFCVCSRFVYLRSEKIKTCLCHHVYSHKKLRKLDIWLC